jgi:hypothetical protein
MSRRPDQIARKFWLIEIVTALSQFTGVPGSNPLKTVASKIFPCVSEINRNIRFAVLRDVMLQRGQ